ncbi:subtilisin-like protease SBT1.4 [Andrographis paniculata]|uniref:subtilisin-like protease SBT1.4 n=1 Tax=Andrographis paniculata TaxID=175694 RepID=UPI0021E8F00C|nr:subtilisin-like protease SBT1.4 [Andrographis paniculata]
MKLSSNHPFHGVSCVIFFLYLTPLLVSSDGQDTFIVHVSQSHKPPVFSTHLHWYSSIIHSLPPHRLPSKLLYTYDRAIRGFSARISAAQADALRRVPGVISVVPDELRHIHTTRTPDFLGLSDSFGLWPNSDYADDVIIGVLDTGIWPERPSFSDEGLSPVPSHWKGSCVDAPGFPSTLCNRKIIGARAFYLGYAASQGLPMAESDSSLSPRDTEGHGTHTSSTAAGSRVVNASLFGFAAGEARGMAEKARIAVYKICWTLGCYDSDILAAMELAIHDGVNVISLSVGANGYAPPYDYDSIAVGAFSAAEHGIVVSCSAGNSGPSSYSAVNIAPWILTVGASTLDREFPADAILGDGNIYRGVSLYSGEALDDKLYPLVYAADCGSRYCYLGYLEPSKVAGKIVICDRGGNARVEKGSAVHLAGGVGMILANLADSGEELLADAHFIPSTMVGEIAGDKIRAYVRTSSNPTATIRSRGTVVSKSPSSPRVASFSSRGPNYRTAEILKPDVIAPGVNILAGWTGYVGPTSLDSDDREVEFNIISGTSMSCPHVSGLAALLKQAHPEWSPAAIKSALMTTAYNIDNNGNNLTDLATGDVSNPFVHGSGHVDPNRATDPGLIYDIDTQNYVAFLCSIGYNARQITTFTKDSSVVDCNAIGLKTPGDLNYPSFSVAFSGFKSVLKYKRNVRNVGTEANAVYEVTVHAPDGVEVSVTPSKLEFSEKEDTLSYEVEFKSRTESIGLLAKSSFGSIEWSDRGGGHRVTSPIAVVWGLRTAAEM